MSVNMKRISKLTDLSLVLAMTKKLTPVYIFISRIILVKVIYLAIFTAEHKTFGFYACLVCRKDATNILFQYVL